MKKILEIGLYVFLFLFPWQTRWIFQSGEIGGGRSEYLTYSIYVSDILVVILLILVCLSYTKKIKPSKKKRALSDVNGVMNKWHALNHSQQIILFCDAAFFVFAILSVIFADNKSQSMQAIARLGLAFGLGWLIYCAPEFKKILLWFSLGLVFPAWLAIWQFLFQQTFANKWLGLAKHDAWQGGTSVVETFTNSERTERWLRAYGSFDHPNILGAMMAIGTLVILWLIAERIYRKRYGQYLLWIMLISLSSGCFVSISRSAWLALGIGLIIGAGILIKQKKGHALKFWLEGFAIIAIIFSVFGCAYKDVVMVRTQSDVRLEIKSMDDRAIFFKQGKEMIKSNLVVGVGIGNYVARRVHLDPNQPFWEYQPVHNVPLMIWAEIGILGMLVFIIVYAVICAYAINKNNFVVAIMLIALIPVLLLDHWLWSLHAGIFLLAIVGGIALRYNKES